MQINKLLRIIQEILPEETAMEGDRVGLQIQSGNEEINRILVTMEVDELVVQEAIDLNCDCIITFHPLIFFPLTAITNTDRVGKLCNQIIKNSISLIAIHTNFDAFPKGTSYIFAKKLNLTPVEFIVPDKNFENYGMGIIASCDLSQSELLLKVHQITKSPMRFSYFDESKRLKSIAIVGGSGISFLDKVMSMDIQAFITADVSYHYFHKVKNKLLLIDPGHYEMERFVSLSLSELLIGKIDTSDYEFIKVSSIFTNPVCYYPETGKYLSMQKNYV